MRALPVPARGPLPGPLLRPGVRPVVPQLGLLRPPHDTHPALGGRAQPGRLAHRCLSVQGIVDPNNFTSLFHENQILLYLKVRDTFCSYGVMELCTRGLVSFLLTVLTKTLLLNSYH